MPLRRLGARDLQQKAFVRVMSIEVATPGKGLSAGAAIAAALAVLLLGACSSKNPDSLIGMNLDENLAAMNADEVSDSNEANVSNDSGHAEAAPQADTRASSNTQRSVVVNDVGSSTPDENESAANQIEQNDEQPPDGR